MLKITFIGAGSLVFGENILTDILTFPMFKKDVLICLEDVDLHRLDLMFKYMQRYKEDYSKEFEGVTFQETTDQKKAIEEAKYVVCAVQVGGLEAYKLDLDIPLKYGVSQCIGDTLGPGGVFRFLRTAPVLKSIVEDMRDIGFNAGADSIKPLLLNYANPMAMNTWFSNAIVPDSTVGLCHGVQDTSNFIRSVLGVKPENFSYLCAGINHMAWFLGVWYKDPSELDSTWKNAYPLFKKISSEKQKPIEMEKVRFDMMNAVGGYFMTESSGHLSEYIPYYRKRTDLLEKFKGTDLLFGHLQHASYYNYSIYVADKIDRKFEKQLSREKLRYKATPSDEYASYILNAMETNEPFVFNGNVINKGGGLITNLPKECCVEVPTFADNRGLHPQGGITLPTICQALCISNIMVQKAAVEGALELNREKIYHAVLLDPNTASICSPGEIREMVNELFEAEAKWLPQFK